MLDFDLFRRVVDEAGPSLVRIDFFNYGEAFLHKRAVEMCEYIKTRFPHIYLYTSTNGLALTEAQARRLVHSGIDEVTFSIDGATQESYVEYRQRGRFDVAIANLRAMADEKRRAGRDLPFLNWRYILFNWNDSDEEMDARAAARRRDRRRSAVLGDHRSSRERVLAAFRARLAGARRRSTTRSGTTTTSATPFPGATPRARIDVRTLRAGRAARWRATGRPLQVRTRVHNLSTRAVSGAGDLRPPAGPPRRAAVRRRRRAHQPRFRARVAAADPRRPAAARTSPIEIPAPDAARDATR